MKRFKRIMVLTLAAVLSLSLGIPALATEIQTNQVVEGALAQVTALYEDVYTISDASAVLRGQESDEDGNIIYTVEASFKRTLKATDAMQIPAIQGMIRAKEALVDAAEIQAAEEYIAARVADMNDNYIGVAQGTNVTLRVTLPAVMPLSVPAGQMVTSNVIEVECGIGEEEYGALETIAPRNAVVQIAAGRNLVSEVAASSSGVSPMSVDSYPHNERIRSYNRVAARNYARKWSCNKGISTDHATCHNPEYSFFPSKDCANFVSQCFVAGGLVPTDNVWKPYTSAWNTTGNNGNGLRQYVVNNDLFFKTTNIDKAFAGSIINQLNSDGSDAGHVGLIDQNDFYTVTFCAHTNCRSQKPVSFISHKNYYVPYYDSYGGAWVEP